MALKTESDLESLLRQGVFVVTAELGPPKSADAAAVEKKADYLAGSVDGANITDNQTAIVRMSSIATALIAIRKGLEPVIQMTCRDRNRLAIQSDIIGAYTLGIKNVLCLSGDHLKFGNHPNAKPVFDLDSVSLIQMIRRMRDEGIFQCGEEIKNSPKAPLLQPKMFIGGAANPFAEPYAFRVTRLAKKIEAGADFIQTQPVFDMARFKEWLKGVRDMGSHEKVYIMAGVMPVRSYKALEYMKNEVPGISIPQELIDRMKGAADPKEEGVSICVEQIEELKTMGGVHGLHIMAVEWEAIVPEVVKRAGLLPRPQKQTKGS